MDAICARGLGREGESERERERDHERISLVAVINNIPRRAKSAKQTRLKPVNLEVLINNRAPIGSENETREGEG